MLRSSDRMIATGRPWRTQLRLKEAVAPHHSICVINKYLSSDASKNHVRLSDAHPFIHELTVATEDASKSAHCECIIQQGTIQCTSGQIIRVMSASMSHRDRSSSTLAERSTMASDQCKQRA